MATQHQEDVVFIAIDYFQETVKLFLDDVSLRMVKNNTETVLDLAWLEIKSISVANRSKCVVKIIQHNEIKHRVTFCRFSEMDRFFSTVKQCHPVESSGSGWFLGRRKLVLQQVAPPLDWKEILDIKEDARRHRLQQLEARDAEVFLEPKPLMFRDSPALPKGVNEQTPRYPPIRKASTNSLGIDHHVETEEETEQDYQAKQAIQEELSRLVILNTPRKDVCELLHLNYAESDSNSGSPPRDQPKVEPSTEDPNATPSTPELGTMSYAYLPTPPVYLPWQNDTPRMKKMFPPPMRRLELFPKLPSPVPSEPEELEVVIGIVPCNPPSLTEKVAQEPPQELPQEPFQEPSQEPSQEPQVPDSTSQPTLVKIPGTKLMHDKRMICPNCDWTTPGLVVMIVDGIVHRNTLRDINHMRRAGCFKNRKVGYLAEDQYTECMCNEMFLLRISKMRYRHELRKRVTVH